MPPPSTVLKRNTSRLALRNGSRQRHASATHAFGRQHRRCCIWSILLASGASILEAEDTTFFSYLKQAEPVLVHIIITYHTYTIRAIRAEKWGVNPYLVPGTGTAAVYSYQVSGTRYVLPMLRIKKKAMEILLLIADTIHTAAAAVVRCCCSCSGDSYRPTRRVRPSAINLLSFNLAEKRNIECSSHITMTMCMTQSRNQNEQRALFLFISILLTIRN